MNGPAPPWSPSHDPPRIHGQSDGSLRCEMPDLNRFELLPSWTEHDFRVAMDAAQLRADALRMVVRVVDTDGAVLATVRPEEKER